MREASRATTTNLTAAGMALGEGGDQEVARSRVLPKPMRATTTTGSLSQREREAGMAPMWAREAGLQLPAMGAATARISMQQGS